MENLSSVVSGNLGKAIEELDKLLRSPRARVEIMTLNRQMKMVTAELGAKTLELYRAGRIEDVELGELCARIVSIDARIKEREARLAAQAKAADRAGQPAGPLPVATPVILHCPRCQTPLADDAVLCSRCGFKVSTAAAAAVAPEGLYCAQCGRELRPEARFCPRCGNPA
jgi:hypothetical protein